MAIYSLYEFMGFWIMDGYLLYELIGFRTMDGYCPYALTEFGAMGVVFIFELTLSTVWK